MNRFNLKAFDMQKYKIDNLENMKPIISQLANDIKIKFPLSEEKFFDIRLVLSELVMNAFKHSKSDEFVDIFLNNDYSDSEIKITVEDYGCGFDFENVYEKPDAKDIYNNGGRGIKLVKALCENVTYNEMGNSVSIIIRV